MTDQSFADIYAAFSSRVYVPTPAEEPRFRELAERGYLCPVAEGHRVGYGILPPALELIERRMYPCGHQI